MYYFGLAPQIEVAYRNDRTSDTENLKAIISLAAEKAHENSEFKEKTKADSVNFLLEKFATDSKLPPNSFQKSIGLGNPINIATSNSLADATNINIEDDINISELAKKHPSTMDMENNTQPQMEQEDMLPPIN